MGKKRKRQKPSLEKSPSWDEPPVREKPAGRKKKKGQPVLKKRERPNWPLTALAGAGMVLTAYLVLTSWLGQPPLYCDEGSSCDIVQQSRWGTFLGLPTAFWGFLTYATLAYIGFRVRHPVWHWKSAWTVSLVGLGYSVYLIAISLLVIDATCAYCLASFSIMAVIFGVIIFQRPVGLPDFKYATWAGQTIAMALVIVGGMHLHYSGVFDPAAGPEDPYLRGLAEHLSRENAVFYGAFWCPSCVEQKDLFEASADRLPYVECSPRGRTGPKAAVCWKNNINSYPIWLIGGRRYKGILKPDRLAVLSGYPGIQ